MKPLFRKAFTHLPASNRGSNRRGSVARRQAYRFKRYSLVLLLILSCLLSIGLTTTLATAQSESPESPQPSPSTETLRENNVNERKERTPPDTPQPNPPVKGPQAAAPTA